MAAIAQPRARVAVKACHSSSKTFTAAEIVLWWVERGGIAVTTAPTWTQVKRLLWGEITRSVQGAVRPLTGTLLTTEYHRSADAYAIGLSTNEGVNFQGFHGAVLIVMDEAPGVRPDIFEAIEGIRAGGDVRVLMLGNPTIASGPFYDAFGRERRSWQTFTIDAFATPNLAGVGIEDLRAIPLEENEDHPLLNENPRPYLTTRRWVHEKLHTWGEDSPLWQSRVRGQFPLQSEDALLSLAWLEAAGRREIPPTDADEWEAGIDVAGPGEAETSLAIRAARRWCSRSRGRRPTRAARCWRNSLPFKDRLRASRWIASARATTSRGTSRITATRAALRTSTWARRRTTPRSTPTTKPSCTGRCACGRRRAISPGSRTRRRWGNWRASATGTTRGAMWSSSRRTTPGSAASPAPTAPRRSCCATRHRGRRRAMRSSLGRTSAARGGGERAGGGDDSIEREASGDRSADAIALPMGDAARLTAMCTSMRSWGQRAPIRRSYISRSILDRLNRLYARRRNAFGNDGAVKSSGRAVPV
jgi:hypothetical protein